MTDKNKYLYPVTPETIHKYAASIFTPILRGESVTTVWVPMAGRRMWNKFVIEKIQTFGKKLPSYKKYLLVYIEPLDLTEESLAGYLRLMAKSFIEVCKNHETCKNIPEIDSNFKIFDDESASYSKLLEALKELLSLVINSGLEIVFFLGEFDEFSFANTVFHNNLKSLWEKLLPNLHYVFLTTEDLASYEMTSKLRELNAASLQNVIYIPIREEKDIEYLINFFGSRLNYEFNAKEKNVIEEYCGGHPYLIKTATRIISSTSDAKSENELKEILKNNYELSSAVKRMYELRTEQEKTIFRNVVNEGKIDPNDDLKRLVNLGLLLKRDSSLEPFCQLLKETIENQIDKEVIVPTYGTNGLEYDQGNGTILIHGVPVEEKFTRQEYSILAIFLQDSNKLKTRDDIGEALWGKNSYEKYSDWAIDQLISKLRKKLKTLSIKTEIVTIRGRGYKLLH